MSLIFSDTATFKGLVQMYEIECGFELGDISGNTEQMKMFAAEVNQAIDDYIAMAVQSSGTWQYDDSNHPTYPEIVTDLNAGQRDYAITTDGSGNLVLDIYRVFTKPSASAPYEEIFPVDQQSDPNTQGYTDGQNTTGTPQTYDKTGNGIFLDPIPENTVEDGLKLMINREGFYFVYTDTSRKPGVPGFHHAYFWMVPALKYARIHTLESHDKLEAKIEKMEKSIKAYFGKRAKDEKPVLRGKCVPHE